MKRLTRAMSLRAGIAIAVGLTASIAIAPTLASGAEELGSANTVYIKAGKGGLRFVAPKTIVSGESLEVLNTTNPKQVGPHTFSLVRKGYVPKNAKRAQSSASRRNTSASRSPTGTGSKARDRRPSQPGRSRPRRLGHDGHPDQEGRLLVHRPEAEGLVHAGVSAAPGTTIYFVCAVHPWMHGSIEVVAAAGQLAPTAGRSTDSPRLGRRAFLGALGGGVLATSLPLPLGLRPGALLPSSEPAPRPAGEPFRRPLPIPRVLSDAKLAIPIREAERAGPARAAKTRMWTYGGSFPGPTIRRPAGHRTAVTFRHELPRSAGELTVHLHGGHNRTQFDGQPGGLTKSHPRSYYCRIPSGLTPRAVGQRPPDQAGRRAHLRLRPGRGRPARAGGVPVVPRPPPRPHRPQRLARAGRDVDHRRRVRRRAAAARAASATCR